MKQLIKTAAVAIFGGFVALGTYLYFFEKEIPVTVVEPKAQFTLSKYDSSPSMPLESIDFVGAANRSLDAVVHVKTVSESQQYYNPWSRYFGGDPYSSKQQRSSGSGVIISDDGFIVTNNHVIENASEIEVVLSDNRNFEAEVIGVDKNTDLAVIKIDEKNLNAIKYGNSENINIGEWVLAIGNPYEFRSTVTAGIVSAKGRNINIINRELEYRIESFIQTDAAVNPGNSGGALVNLNGELVGINTAIASPSGAFAGYSFAVPVTLVKKVVDDLVEFGTVQRALLGIRIQDVNAEVADEYGLDVLSGVYVAGVNPNGAAGESGIEVGDVITSINGKPVNNVAQLQEQIAVNRPGDEVIVTYIRNGKKREVSATLKNAQGTMEIVEAKNQYEFEGATFIEVENTLKNRLNLDGGVQIIELNDGKWEQARMREGFIITEIDNKKISNLGDLEDFMDNPREDGILIEGVYPNGEKAYYGLGL